MSSVRTLSLAPRSRDSSTETSRSLFSKLTWRKQTQSSPPKATWKPTAFRLLPLTAAILASWVLIVALQLLLIKSQREGGVIVAETIDDIPLGKSFLYRYLPTIVALIFSVYWSWIDLQVKRLEPYYQLSKPGGAWGKDSLLLSYPFDFLPFVPLSALRRKYDYPLGILCVRHADYCADIGLCFGPAQVSCL